MSSSDSPYIPPNFAPPTGPEPVSQPQPRVEQPTTAPVYSAFTDSPFAQPTPSTGSPYPQSSPYSAPIDFAPPSSSTPADSGYAPASDSGYAPAPDSGYASGSSDSGYAPAPMGDQPASYPSASGPASPYPQANTPTAYPQAYPAAQPPVAYPASPYPPADTYGTPYPNGGFASQGYAQPTTGYDYGGYQEAAYPTQEYPSYPPVPDPYAPAPYVAPYAAPPYVFGYNPTEKNSQGVAALVLGILSVCCLGLLTGILAIVFGVQGRKAADEGRATNKGTATAGMVLGIIGSVFVGLYWIYVFAS